MWVRSVTIVLFLLFASNPAAASAPEPETVALARTDALVRRLAAQERFSGVVLIARDGRLLMLRSYGLADRGRGIPARADTSFHLASLGKMFTATAILQLVAAGRLSLDDNLGKILPDYPNLDVAEKVTVRHLLTHSGGTGDIDIFEPRHAANRARMREHSDFLALHGGRAPGFAPGSSQSYSNYGYVLLGAIVERITGRLYRDYVAEHIFRPAGMVRSGFPRRSSPTRHLALGYTSFWPDPEKPRRPAIPNIDSLPWRGTAAGGGAATAQDLLRFVHALQAGRLIPASLFTEQIKPQLQASGYGIWRRGEGAKLQWGHGGGAWGMNTEVRTYPATGHTVIVLANLDPPAAMIVADAFDYFRFDPEGRTPVFLRGSMNDWSISVPLSAAGAALTVEIVLPAGEHQFKLASEDWASIDLGLLAPRSIEEEAQDVPLGFHGANVTLVVRKPGLFRFNLTGLREGSPLLSLRRVRDSAESP